MKIPRRYSEATSQGQYLLWAASQILAALALAVGFAVLGDVFGHWNDTMFGALGAALSYLTALLLSVVMLLRVALVGWRTITALWHEKD